MFEDGKEASHGGLGNTGLILHTLRVRDRRAGRQVRRPVPLARPEHTQQQPGRGGVRQRRLPRRVERHTARAAGAAAGLCLPHSAQRRALQAAARRRAKARRQLHRGAQRAGGVHSRAGGLPVGSGCEGADGGARALFGHAERGKPRDFPAALLVCGQMRRHRQARRAERKSRDRAAHASAQAAEKYLAEQEVYV